MSRITGFPEYDWAVMTVSQVRDAWGQPRAEDAFDYADIETLIQGVSLVSTMNELIVKHGDINIIQALIQEYNTAYPSIRIEVGSKIPSDTPEH